MTRISEIMTPNCEWVTPDTTLHEVAQNMKQQNCGFLPVGEDDRLVGMITDRDIVIRGIAEGKDPRQAAAGEIMTAETFYCYDDQNAEDVADNMAQMKVRRMPVVNRQKRLVGIISSGDLAQFCQNEETGETLRGITADLQQNRMAA